MNRVLELMLSKDEPAQACRIEVRRTDLHGGTPSDGEGPYVILGVGHGAPLSEIKRAYRKLAFNAHPDIGDNPDVRRFREVHEAYETLNETEQRRPRRIGVVRTPDRSGCAGTTQWRRGDVRSWFGGNVRST